MKNFLFVLCPPYSGSTVLWKILGTSPQVSILPREGQFLDEVREVMRDEPYNADKKIPWKEIRAQWEQYEDPSKPIFLEKSPPNLVRAFEIEREFEPCHFIAMIRDPYATCEGIYRRGHKTLEETTKFWISCAQYQKINIEGLKHIINFSYEKLVENTPLIKDQILEFIPELESLDIDITPKIHSVFGREHRKITNLNKHKINRLSNQELSIINNILEKHNDIMEFFGYTYIYPSFKRRIIRHMQNPLTRFNLTTRLNRKIKNVRTKLCN